MADICFRKPSIFCVSVSQEVVAGVVVIQSKSDIQHQGVTLTMDGTVNLQLSAKSVGLFEAFYNSLKVCDHKLLFFVCLFLDSG